MFERAMRARSERTHGGITGATLPSIKAYLANETSPRKEFWDAAGTVLGVRPEWLAFGGLHPTREHEKAAAIAAASLPAGRTDASAVVQVKRAILGDDGTPAAEEFIPYWVGPLADAWLLRDLIPYHGDDAAQLKALAKAVRAPLEALGFSADSMGGSAFSDYMMAMIPVLFGLASHRAQRALAESNRREWEASIRRGEATRVVEAPAKARSKRKPVKKVGKPRRTPATKAKRPRR